MSHITSTPGTAARVRRRFAAIVIGVAAGLLAFAVALLPDETACLTHPAGTSSSGCWPTESKKWATNVTSSSSASNRAMRAPSAS